MTLTGEEKITPTEEEDPYKDYKEVPGKKLYINHKPRLVYYYDHEKKEKYPFKIRELTWAEVDALISKAMKIIVPADGGDPIPDLNIQEMQKQFFLKMVVEHPFSEPLEMAYYKLPIKFRNWVMQFLPEVGFGLSSKEQGESKKL